MQVFDKMEDLYATWLEHHSDGYIVNWPRSGKAKSIVYHRNRAGKICQHLGEWPGHSYTVGKVKLCFDTYEQLAEWYRTTRPANLRPCSDCHPEPL